MKKFSFTVKDNFFSESFEGETEAATLQEAKEDLLDWYAAELGADHNDLTVTLTEIK